MMSLRNLASLGALLVLCACGGGSGSASSGPGGFTLSAASLDFSAHWGQTVPITQDVNMTITGSSAAYVGAAFPGGNKPSWIDVQFSGDGDQQVVEVSIYATQMTPGTYTTTMTVGDADSKGNVLQTKTVPITFHLSDQLGITFSPSLSYAGVLGSDSTSQVYQVQVISHGSKWRIASNAAWLTVPSTTYTDSQTVPATVDVSKLEPGQYQGLLTVTDVADASDTATLVAGAEVDLPAIAFTSTDVTLGGYDGLQSAAVPVQFNLDTGGNSYPWTASLQTSSGGSWLTANVTSGSVKQALDTIKLSADRSGLTAGRYSGTLKIQTTVQGHVISASLPVTSNVAQERLFVSAAGVALSSFPSRQTLSRDLKVTDTQGTGGVAWIASSDQTWLNVTASGTTAGTLTLTADPTGLNTDQQYIANVTVSSSDPTVAGQTVRVGFWVGSADPSAVTLSTTVGQDLAGPVEPYLFLHTEGTTVSVYNMYSGALVKTLSGGFATAGPMAISDDGKTLFVSDTTNFRVVALDVATGAAGTVYHYASAPTAYDLVYARPEGHPVLYTYSGKVFDVATGTPLHTTILGAQFPSVSADGRHLYMGGLMEETIDYSDLLGDLTVGQPVWGSGLIVGASNCRNGALSGDGSKVYLACGYPYDFNAFDSTTMVLVQTLPGDAYPNNTATAWNGVFVGGSDHACDTACLWIYDSNGNALTTPALGLGFQNLLGGSVRISGDATRFFVEGSSSVSFLDLPPP